MINILYIEDNIIDFAVLHLKLKKKEFNIEWVPNVTLGLSLLRVKPFHYKMIICDVMGTQENYTSLEAVYDSLIKNTCDKIIFTSSTVEALQNSKLNYCVKDKLIEYVEKVFSK